MKNGTFFKILSSTKSLKKPQKKEAARFELPLFDIVSLSRQPQQTKSRKLILPAFILPSFIKK